MKPGSTISRSAALVAMSDALLVVGDGAVGALEQAGISRNWRRTSTMMLCAALADRESS
jgi:hypothetical protein